ncbi:MAG: hypothetical protein JKY37_21905, partial [Nannocystaceae bacterium]|nr:hypothetical protein [Nannocystaceae bacterium]
MTANDRNDEILERNVEQLLTRAHEPPRMGPQARNRVLRAIRKRRDPAPAP